MKNRLSKLILAAVILIGAQTFAQEAQHIPEVEALLKKMTLEEKEALFIWLNRDTMPQA